MIVRLTLCNESSKRGMCRHTLQQFSSEGHYCKPPSGRGLTGSPEECSACAACPLLRHRHASSPGTTVVLLAYCCPPSPVLPHSKFLTLDVADCADDVIVQQVLQDLVLLGLSIEHNITHHTTHNTQNQPTTAANDSKKA